MRGARAPRTVVQAIGELNHVAEVAALSRTGDKLAAASLRDILSGSAYTSPGGLPARAGGFGGGFGRGAGAGGGTAAGADAAMLDSLGDLLTGSPCGSALSRSALVLDSAFGLDLKERNFDAKWTRQAHAYLAGRMRNVSSYAGSAERVPRGTGDSGGGFPAGDDDYTAPVLPPGPGDDFDPPGDPVGEGYGSDLCAQLAELCLALYADVLAALARDDYTDLIAVVEANCLCSSYDPNQTFIARPQPGRTFPAPLPAAVFLHFRGQIITPILVAPDEIHFRIPANALTGFVYLRALGALPSMASQRLASACALGMPELPSEILFDRSPAALISIIYPPVIDTLTSDAGLQPAEACTPVEIRWRVHLLDQQASSALIHPCGSIEAILRDAQGNQIAAGGATGSVLETRSEDETYTLEAVSRAGAVQCGIAAPISLTIVRVKYVRLERPAGAGTEHQGGTNGQFLVRISCPAPAGGQQVVLTSSDPAVLQVPSPVTVLGGANSALVDFTTTAACTAAPIRVTAASAGHTAMGSLDYDIYTVPVLQWAAGPPAYVREGGPFSSEVDASCVPDDSGRVNWLLIRTDPNNQQAPIALIAQGNSGQYPALRFHVELPSASARGLIPGNWELVVEIPDRSHLQSQGLAFAVTQRPSFTLALTSPSERTVLWDKTAEYTLAITGQNIPPNVNVPVVITPRGLPPAFQVTTLPVTLNLGNSGQLQNSAIRLLSAAAAGPVGVFPFAIAAAASGVMAPPPAPAVVVVKHQPGAFILVDKRFNSFTCSSGGRAVPATVGGNGLTRTVSFSITTPSQTIVSTFPAIYYFFSPKCRVAVVIPPVGAGTGPAAADLVNVGFEPGTGAQAALGDFIDTFSQISWQRFWFSPDDTLLVVIGRVPRGTSTDTHFCASLHDMLSGQQLDSVMFSPAIIQTAEDPSPFQPEDWMTGRAYPVDRLVTYLVQVYQCTTAHTSGVFATDLIDGKWVAVFAGETEIELAVITGIVLANQLSGDVVTVSYTTPPPAVADTTPPPAVAAATLTLHV